MTKSITSDSEEQDFMPDDSNLCAKCGYGEWRHEKLSHPCQIFEPREAQSEAPSVEEPNKIKNIAEPTLRESLIQLCSRARLAMKSDAPIKKQREAIDAVEAKINRLIVQAKRDQIDEIIDIQEKQFNRWTQKDIAHFFERVGVIYRALSNNLSKERLE